MKTLGKYLLTFLVGVGCATLLSSFFVPGTVHGSRAVVDSGSDFWSLEDYERINIEIPQLVDNPHLTLAVIPTGVGYEVIGFDSRFRARFGMSDLESSLAKIDSRMDALRIKSKKQNKSEESKPNQLSE